MFVVASRGKLEVQRGSRREMCTRRLLNDRDRVARPFGGVLIPRRRLLADSIRGQFICRLRMGQHRGDIYFSI